MKKSMIICLAFLAFGLVSCKENAASKVNVTNLETAKERDAKIGLGSPIIEFDQMEYDFGTITEGEVVDGKFILLNKGKTDLIITEVKPSCGCTTPDWTKEAIKPGESGEIKFSFNSRGRTGKQNKSITIKSNAEKMTEVVRIKGIVIAKS
jgi:hypothetical protein